MGLTNNLVYLLQHLSAVISKQADQLLQSEVGIGHSQYKILMVLEWNPRVQQKAIADSLGQTEASISRQIKLLDKQGLTATKRDEQNRRKHLTTPTVKGMQVTEAATNVMRRTFGSQFMTIYDLELERLLASLQGLHTVVCKPGRIGACNHLLGL